MSNEFEISAVSREDSGKGASRRLRRNDQIPGIVYGGKSEPKNIALSHNELLLNLENEAFYSHILSLKIDGKAEQVILKDLQRHPAKPLLIHVDFQRVSAKSKLKTSVPLHFIGEDVAPGIKMGGASSHNITSVEIMCLPKDLPEFIDVDMSSMEIGDTIHLSGLSLPKGVEIPALSQGEEQDLIVCNMHVIHVASEDEDEAESIDDDAPAAPVAGEDSED